MMISLEKARELKEAGLAWEPRKAPVGDWFYYDGKYAHKNPRMVNRPTDSPALYWEANEKDVYWIPSLSQLLAEIEARGYWWNLINADKVRGVGTGYWIESRDKNSDCADDDIYPEYLTDYHADTPEDAAADALLWILKQEVTP